MFNELSITYDASDPMTTCVTLNRNLYTGDLAFL